MSARRSASFAVVASFCVAGAGCIGGADDDDRGASAGCAAGALAPGSYSEHEVVVDGPDGPLTRRFAVAVPADAEGPLPTLLVFHGDAECLDFDAENNVCNESRAVLGDDPGVTFGFEGVVDAVVVYVEGRNQNRFRPDLLSWDTFSKDDDNADFAAVDAVVAKVRANACVDDDVYAAGFSGGGFFVHSLACLHGGVDAVASFEGGFEAGEVAVSYDADNVVDTLSCLPLPPALIVQADDDTVVPPRYGEAAAAVYASDCAEDEAPTDLGGAVDDACVEFCGDTVLCTPASADPPRTHAVWQPEGPSVAAAFFAQRRD